MSPDSAFSSRGADLLTARLVLRPWSDGELAAVLDGTPQPHWAADFPADGDRVIAGFTAESPDARGVYGQRQILERDGGRVVGAIGLVRRSSDDRLARFRLTAPEASAG